MKKLIFALLLLTLPSYIWAEEVNSQKDTETEVRRQFAMPSNYGSLVVEWGFNALINAPKEMKLGHWGSRTIKGYLYYNIPIKESHFTFSPGIGIEAESYQFRDKYTLARSKSRKTFLKPARALFPNSPEIKQSSLAVKYTELVTELRFNANHGEPQYGLFIALGGKIGLRWGASTTIRYREDSQNKSRITAESFNLSRLRYGLLARVGWGRFGAFYSQTFSALFSEQGPSEATIRPFSIGISINLL
ncbi:MAG: outer membrane beta-barrel protein [Bacteroidota bacterium]